MHEDAVRFLSQPVEAKPGSPLRVAVYSRIAEAIRNSLLTPGSMLPNETELGTDMEVSRTVVREALMLLEEDGLIRGRRSVGRFVSNTIPPQHRDRTLWPFEEVLGGPGHQVEIKRTQLERQPASEFVAPGVGVEPGVDCWAPGIRPHPRWLGHRGPAGGRLRRAGQLRHLRPGAGDRQFAPGKDNRASTRRSDVRGDALAAAGKVSRTVVALDCESKQVRPIMWERIGLLNLRMEAARVSYVVSVHAQDPSAGRVEEVLSALSLASSDASLYEHADVAVAYASASGVKLLHERLSGSSVWHNASKRFLVSIDFGITEPHALELLAGLPNAEVRIPNGRSVLASPTLRPPNTFHAKTYFFRAEEPRAPQALVVGSANLTVNALASGSEVVIRHSWAGPESSEGSTDNFAAPFRAWFEEAWCTADPLDTVIRDYRERYQTTGSLSMAEEATTATTAYTASSEDNEVVGALSVQLALAKGLWVRTDTLYHNLGIGRPGNQLDMPRGTRVFFGFPPTKVGKNHILGYIHVQVDGYAAVSRSVRFGNNEMDKINLPLPSRDGPESYDHAYLVFERAASSNFRLAVTDEDGLSARLKASVHSVKLTMASGREYGLIF